MRREEFFGEVFGGLSDESFVFRVFSRFIRVGVAVVGLLLLLVFVMLDRVFKLTGLVFEDVVIIVIASEVEEADVHVDVSVIASKKYLRVDTVAEGIELPNVGIVH